VNLATFILCGGSSERFGGDKCRAEFAGSTLLETVIAKVDEPVLMVDDTSRFEWLAHPVERISDLRPGAGPAAAIARSIDVGAERGLERVHVISCDMPTFDRSWWDELESVETPAAAFHDGRRWQPLFSSFMPALIDSDVDWAHAGAWRLLEALAARKVDPPDDFDRFVSVNTRRDLDRARAIWRVSEGHCG